jgi:hypothetical protein
MQTSSFSPADLLFLIPAYARIAFAKHIALLPVFTSIAISQEEIVRRCENAMRA